MTEKGVDEEIERLRVQHLIRALRLDDARRAAALEACARRMDFQSGTDSEQGE